MWEFNLGRELPHINDTLSLPSLNSSVASIPFTFMIKCTILKLAYKVWSVPISPLSLLKTCKLLHPLPEMLFYLLTLANLT